MANIKVTRYKLILLYAFCHYASEPAAFKQQQDNAGKSLFTQALLYHQFQPAPSTPLLSRYNRQPHYSNVVNSTQSLDSSPYYLDSTQSQSSYQAAPPQHYRDNRHQQQQSQISFLASRDSPVATSDSSEFEDSYGCPIECRCNKIAQIADCSDRNLTRVPASFPRDIKRIRLERNNITEIGPYAFQGLKRLQRIDLSNNNIHKIDTLAFSGGLQTLNSLILYSNKLEHLPVNVFNELSQLQLLLLNANSLHTIHKDLFQSLANLNLLSLFDNDIVTITSGTFDGLKNIKTIHLGKNPLNCDCNLRWLVEYFESNPVETSEARCESPTRAQGRKLSQLTKSELKCQEVQSSKSISQQIPVQQLLQSATTDATSCPAGCICNGSTVDCSRAPSPSSESRSGGGTYELPDVPDDVPVYMARVHINDNRIKRIRQTGLFRRLANSQKLDLGNNKIVDIEDNAINGQFSNGQKPERVVFVLLENQHCDASAAAPPPTTPVGPQQQQQPGGIQPKSGRYFTNSRQQQQVEDPCAMAPKVNDPHFDSACYNGGVCKPISSSHYANYSCSCPAGFAGPLCEINIDDCVDHQCQNGAMCVDGINSYKCICRDPTTTGEFCEQMSSSSAATNYAASSANSIAPIALPIIAAGGASLLNGVPTTSSLPVYELSTAANSAAEAPYVQPQAIIARSADNIRAPDDLSSNSLTSSPPAAFSAPLSNSQQECQRVTQRKYYDDGNGCQSVRVLKISECAGSCGGQGAGGAGGSGGGGAGGCCLPAKVKRRRIRMQCSDGASYVKTVDLIKKCACANDSSCPARDLAVALGGQPAPVSPFSGKAQKGSMMSQSNSYHKYLAQQKPQQQTMVATTMTTPINRRHPSQLSTSQEDQMLQITHLDAVD